jgi:hypothetical protein
MLPGSRCLTASKTINQQGRIQFDPSGRSFPGSRNPRAILSANLPIEGMKEIFTLYQ